MMAIKQTAGRDALGEFAPQFAQLNDDILFGEVWSREKELPARDRSLVTVTALMAQGLLIPVSFDVSQTKWDHPVGDRGDPDSCRILCRVAKSVGRVPHGKGNLGRGLRNYG